MLTTIFLVQSIYNMYNNYKGTNCPQEGEEGYGDVECHGNLISKLSPYNIDDE